MKDLIEALTIFLKYGDPYRPTNCSHDELAICDIKPSDVSETDKKRLEELSFHVDAIEGYFYSFRFGSA